MRDKLATEIANNFYMLLPYPSYLNLTTGTFDDQVVQLAMNNAVNAVALATYNQNQMNIQPIGYNHQASLQTKLEQKQETRVTPTIDSPIISADASFSNSAHEPSNSTQAVKTKKETLTPEQKREKWLAYLRNSSVYRPPMYASIQFKDGTSYGGMTNESVPDSVRQKWNNPGEATSTNSLPPPQYVPVTPTMHLEKTGPESPVGSAIGANATDEQLHANFEAHYQYVSGLEKY